VEQESGLRNYARLGSRLYKMRNRHEWLGEWEATRRSEVNSQAVELRRRILPT